ncbi:MAG: Fic family protein, partial [Candidatus Paceibacterota bacterium]
MKRNRLNNRIKLSNEILAKVTRIDEFKGKWSGSLSLNPKILGQLKKSVIITSTGSSTRIEGAGMSDNQIDRFLRGLNQNPPKNRDEQEVAGYANLLGRIFDNYKTLKISENLILQFHDIMLKFSEKDELHKGHYKKEDNTVAIVESGEIKEILFKPTPPYLVKKEMDDVISWYYKEMKNEEIHPLIIIANFIFEFLAIHPFKDGNGRLSRALTNLMMLRNGYSYVPYVSHEEIIEERQSDYYLSLRETQKNHKTDKADITPWFLFFLDIILEQSKRAEEILQKKDPVKLLSDFQKRIYDLFDSNNELSVSDIKKETGIILSTVKQATSKLVEHGLLERIGQG